MSWESVTGLLDQVSHLGRIVVGLHVAAAQSPVLTRTAAAREALLRRME
jgi:hypothetical protein